MVFAKYLRYHHHFRAIFIPHKPYSNPTNLTSLTSPHSTSLYSFIFSRTFSLSARFAHKASTKSTENAKETGNKAKKSLGVLFKEAAGLSEMPQQRDSDSESGNEDAELWKKLRELEKEIRFLKENKLKETVNNNEKKGDNLLKKKNKPEDDRVSISKNNKCSKPKPMSLSALFSKKPADSCGNAKELMGKGKKPISLSKKPADSSGNANELMRKGEKSISLSKLPADRSGNASKRIRLAEPIVYKELPGNMVEFARVLYQLGYLKNVNFLPQDKFDATAFANNFARDFLKHAARRFGKDHQEIAK